MLLALALAACSHPVSPALQMDAPTAAPMMGVEPTDPREKLTWMLAGDPLARRPRVPAQPPDAAVAAWSAVAAQAEPTAAEWWALEQAWPGTIVVPLARGARLSVIEASVSDAAEAMDQLTPLGRSTVPTERPRSPLAWSGVVGVRDLLPVAERGVMLGWLDGPGIDLAPVAALLAEPDWDRVASAPAGQLVRARAAGAKDAAKGAAGATDLARVTVYALLQAAADSDKEQAAAKEAKEALRAELGVTTEPRGALLTRARVALTANAGDDASLGMALVALEGERLARACPDAPCTGLDRVRMLQAARRWGGPGVALADVWTVTAFKDARDHLEVAYSEPSYPSAMDEIVEVLLGLGAGPFDRSLLEQAAPGPSVHLAIIRGLGGGDYTSREAMSVVLDRALVGAAQRALDEIAGGEAGLRAVGADVAALREGVERIRKRAEAKAGPSVPVPAPKRP